MPLNLCAQMCLPCVEIGMKIEHSLGLQHINFLFLRSDPDCEIPKTADPEEDSKAPYFNVVEPQLTQWDDAGYGRPLRPNQSNS